MATLRDIQVMLDAARPRLTDHAYVETVLWPDIKEVLPQCTDLDGVYPEDMGKLIYQWQNKYTLHGTPAPINLNSMKGTLKAGKGQQIPEPGEVFEWLPW